MFFTQDDKCSRATEGVTTVSFQSWDSAETTLPVLTPGKNTKSKKKKRSGDISLKLWFSRFFVFSCWSVRVVPEDPVGRVLKQFCCQDVCERSYRGCTVRTPVEVHGGGDDVS